MSIANIVPQLSLLLLSVLILACIAWIISDVLHRDR